MRVAGVLTLALVALLPAGCGEDGRAGSSVMSGVTGRVQLGPQCPVEIAGTPCPDRPASGATVTVARRLPGESYAGGEVVASTTTDADGSYRVAIRPGTYVVTADAGMSCEVMDAQVDADAYTDVDVACDTGIR